MVTVHYCVDHDVSCLFLPVRLCRMLVVPRFFMQQKFKGDIHCQADDCLLTILQSASVAIAEHVLPWLQGTDIADSISQC